MPDLTADERARMRAEAAARPGYAVYPPRRATPTRWQPTRTATPAPIPPQLDPTPRPRTDAMPRLAPDRHADLVARVRAQLDQAATEVAAIRAAPVRPARKPRRPRWWWPW